jgi:DNA (cytosine-5)-methyltransferase 1
MQKKCIDLFSGIGGMRLGAENNGFKNVFSSEIDQGAIETYRDNFGDTPHGNIFDIKASKIPDFDLLLAGFPCQPFSFAGKTNGFSDSRGTLFFEVERIIRTKKPDAILLENVKGIINHDEGKTIKVIQNALEKNGYSVSWCLLDAKDFGLPQRRERWYCVALKGKGRKFTFPEPPETEVKLKSILEKKVNPNTKISKAWSKRIDNHMKSKEERVEHGDFNHTPGSARSRHGVFSKLNKDKTLRFHMGDPRKSQIQEGFFCSAESIAPTVIANRVPQLWDEKRKLSVRECARLQGFGDDFAFPGIDSQSYKQIGNSVAVPVVSQIIAQIKSTLDNKIKKSHSRAA